MAKIRTSIIKNNLQEAVAVRMDWQAPVLSTLGGKLTRGGEAQVGPEGSGYAGALGSCIC